MNLAVDVLGKTVFLPEEMAYVKAVLRQGGINPCASESIILYPEGKEYILDWRQLPCVHSQIAYHTDGNTRLNVEKQRTRVLHATYFVAFVSHKSGLPFFAAKIVLWRPYAMIWELAGWLRKEMTDRSK